MNRETKVIYDAVLAALQPAEERGGPEGLEYIDLMMAVAAECQARVVAFGAHALEPAHRDPDPVYPEDGAVLLDVDGTWRPVQGEIGLAKAQHLVGGCVQLVAVRLDDGREAQLLMDEEARLKKDVPINDRASVLYGREPILGAALVLTGERRWK